MRGRKNPGGQRPRQGPPTGDDAAAFPAAAAAAADDQPLVVPQRQPRWIRFLARRLRCMYIKEDRCVVDWRQSAQAQVSVAVPRASRRHRLRLRRRRRHHQEPSSAANLNSGGKHWQGHGAREEAGSGVYVHPAEEARATGEVEDEAGSEDADKPSQYASPTDACTCMQMLCPQAVPRRGLEGLEAAEDGARTATQEAATATASPSSDLLDSAACALPAAPAAAAGPEPFGGSHLEARGEAPSAGFAAADAAAAVAAPSVSASAAASAAASPSLSAAASLPIGPQVSMWPLVSLEEMAAEDMSRLFEKLEQQRMRFNKLQRQAAATTDSSSSSSSSTWDRRQEVQSLSSVLINASVRSMLGSEGLNMPCVHSHDGIQVWKGESGVGNLACRATFLLPVSPRLYASFASNSDLRSLWDKNVTEQHVVEQLDAGHDICYVAFRRVATVYPRDVCTLRVKCRFRTNPKVAGSTEGLPEADGALSTTSSNGQGTEAEAEATAYASMSCSIDHPDVPEAPGRVRMDIRVNAYLAKPVWTPFGLWSEVTLFNESDPGGWIPAAITRTMSAKLLPSTVEKFSAQIMKHYSCALLSALVNIVPLINVSSLRQAIHFVWLVQQHRVDRICHRLCGSEAEDE
ncbi:hypothetical protein, conserved [Eimeria tenella]|uniref:START domain-containing protein n=1 Tax=Eimeria tenella TaxID=5802 RepID=U6L287_EIMTE|nr:hypothetical protein, conserved [Eimeria tenella]CDJ42719.1 hypothetical protein, conserved [Eimeria tenella]|eukprot:XP_013233469.1 hypothetical protein, conserved [Eimeria tenella]